MRKLIKYDIPVSVLGIIICILLIISKFLGLSDVQSLLAANQILVVIILCLCIHFVRRVSAVSHIHVWDDRYLLFLISLPVINLFVTALQIIIGNNSLFSNPLFKAALTVFSLPLFFCCFFIYSLKQICNEKFFKYSCFLLWISGSIYFLIRLLDRTVFPMMQTGGLSVSSKLLIFVSGSSVLSTVIYSLSIICFAILLFYNNKNNKKEQN